MVGVVAVVGVVGVVDVVAVVDVIVVVGVVGVVDVVGVVAVVGVVDVGSKALRISLKGCESKHKFESGSSLDLLRCCCFFVMRR